jgi:uncharacterized repeat protein (TIGR01451 family)
MLKTLRFSALLAFITASLMLASPAAAQSASVSLVKNASTDPVAPGATLTYTLSISNEGPDDALNVVVSDPLPAGTTFSAITVPGGWNCTTPAVGVNGTVNCSIPDFAPVSALISIDVVVGALPDGTLLTNTATVTSTTPDPDPNDNSSTTNTTVTTPVATLTVTKTGAPNPVDAGNDLSYTITASNNGSVVLDTATVTDPLPPGTTFVSLASPGGWACTTPAVGANGTVTCSMLAAPANSSFVFTLVAHVPSNAPTGPVTNQATFFSDVGGRDTTLLATAVNQVQISADLQVTNNDAPDPVVAGSNLVYTIGVNNAGPSDAASVSLTDSLPAGTTFVSLASPGSWSCTTPAVGAHGSVSCSGPVIALATATFTLTVNTNASLAGSTVLTDNATATFASDPNNGNNTGTATTTVNPNPVTTTVIAAPTVTFNANGIVTVTVSTPGTTPTGNVTLSVDGGAPLSQPLVAVNGTSAAAVFTITSPAVGSHTLAANYPAQGPFNASSATGTLVVLPALPVLGGKELLALAAALMVVATVALGRR